MAPRVKLECPKNCKKVQKLHISSKKVCVFIQVKTFLTQSKVEHVATVNYFIQKNLVPRSHLLMFFLTYL